MTTEAKRESKRLWRLNNRDKVLAEKKRYREKHKAQIRASEQAYYFANKPKRLALGRKWALANPEKSRKASRECAQRWRAANPELMRERGKLFMRKRMARVRATETPEQKEIRMQRERERHRIFRLAHPEKIIEFAERYRSTHRAERLKASRLYSIQNKERLAEKQRRYRRANPHIHSNQKHRRRAKELSATVEDCSPRIKELRQATTCHWCSKSFGKDRVFSVDHVIPLSRGGQHRGNNLVASCRSCNSRKHDKLPNEWLREVA